MAWTSSRSISLRTSGLESSGGDLPRRLRVPRIGLTRIAQLWPAPVPVVLGLGYLVLLIARYPQLIRWQDANSDVASQFVLPGAILGGHTGVIRLSTQGSWIQLGFGLLTHGLPFHRILWELSASMATIIAFCLLVWIVARVADRRAALVCAAVLLAASPTALLSFSSASFHNLSPFAAVLLDGFLVWLADSDEHRRSTVIGVSLTLGLITGGLLASDELVAVVAIVPCFLAAFVLSFRTRDYQRLLPVVAVCAEAVAVAHLVNHWMYTLGYRVSVTPLHFGPGAGSRLVWLGQGLLRMGNGLSVGPHPAFVTPLVVAAGAVTVVALLAAARIASRGVGAQMADRHGRARAVHAKFWGASLLMACAAYVLTSTAVYPSDRYFVIAAPAVAALVPLAMSSARRSRVVTFGASVCIAASLAALASGQVQHLYYRGVAVSRASQIASVLRREHLRIGYAGYWDAENLDWSSHGAVAPRPVANDHGRLAPEPIMSVAAWYRTRPHTPSYLILAPGDAALPASVPSSLPTPSHLYRVGNGVTVAVWPFDIAADFDRYPQT